ncbi:MAG: hypothetical protein RL685_183 [Pseudomonadota bacterium]
MRLEKGTCKMIVADCMSYSPFVAQATDSVGKVCRLLREADVRHLPVVDAGMLVGIVSDRDLQGPLSGASGANAPLWSEQVLERPISTLMSSDVISVDTEADVDEVIDLMIEHKIGAVPVVEPHTLKVIGIVSYIDVLRAARAALA